MDPVCVAELVLKFASGVFAALAAAAWLRASLIKAPTDQEMQPQLTDIVARQSRWNASAALLAGLAAACQIPLAFMPTCWG